ncbi:DUF2197 domain-containing protein [Bacillus sp. HMF5848]|uniref:YlaI family protein n=1 Tax=Bacillus sp. HMF5848 TaxID=2495421 RepID=UPI000F77A6A4|nr:YlaI family protein [Bacillus sp. HMF5848]RSK26888.1 DUF2197 domain-containing protein [Bacillus sp. HMF5848]
MRVKCVICDQIEQLDDHILAAKKLRNRPIHTYMCQPCHERIAKKTKERLETGQFRLYKGDEKKDDW